MLALTVGDIVRKNWHPIVEELMRWEDLPYVEWNSHKSNYILKW